MCFGSHVSAADTFTLLSKASATVTVYRGHRRTLLPARVNSLFIMCIGIIRNSSLVDGRARAESNPGHWVSHAVLHMAAECVNHSATKAGQHMVLNRDFNYWSKWDNTVVTEVKWHNQNLSNKKCVSDLLEAPRLTWVKPEQHTLQWSCPWHGLYLRTKFQSLVLSLALSPWSWPWGSSPF